MLKSTGKWRANGNIRQRKINEKKMKRLRKRIKLKEDLNKHEKKKE